MKKCSYCLFLFFIMIICFRVDAQTIRVSTKISSTQWFTDARFGMFIHWDMSSLTGKEISWSRKATKPLDITGDAAGYVEDTAYDNLYKQFNPQKFDADAWVRLAKNAGMKYLVFTAKHHGGFCMWDTKMTDYSITHSPFKRDVVKELATACHKAGLKFGIYYSPRDWHQPDYGIGDNKKYLSYMNEGLKELLTNYGKIDILWWDSYGHGNLQTFWGISKTFELVKKLQPAIIMNNRLAILGDYNQQPAPYIGDWDTPEQRLGEFQNTRPWESCMTLVDTPDGGGWSFRPDGKLRSFKECIRSLVSCASGDGNLLLDAGPNASGEIPSDQSLRLLEMGNWLKKYGQSIYNTRGGPYLNGNWGGSTYRGKKIYLHVINWNGNQLILPALKANIIKCTNFTNPLNKVTFQQHHKNLAIFLEKNKQDNTDTIIELELNGNAVNELNSSQPIKVLELNKNKKMFVLN